MKIDALQYNMMYTRKLNFGISNETINAMRRALEETRSERYSLIDKTEALIKDGLSNNSQARAEYNWTQTRMGRLFDREQDLERNIRLATGEYSSEQKNWACE